MPRILITGMSGTGKSSVIRELAQRGYRAIDTGWNPDWEQPPTDSDGPGWVWREDRISELLAEDQGGALFVAACVENQSKFYGRFEQIVVLRASKELTSARLRDRTSNEYGKTPEELEQVLRFKREVEPLLLRSATVQIDTAIPLEEVVSRLVELVSQ